MRYPVLCLWVLLVSMALFATAKQTSSEKLLDKTPDNTISGFYQNIRLGDLDGIYSPVVYSNILQGVRKKLSTYRRVSYETSRISRGFGVKRPKKSTSLEKIVIYDYIGEMVSTWIKNRYKQQGNQPKLDEKQDAFKSDAFIQFKEKLLEHVQISTLLKTLDMIQHQLDVPEHRRIDLSKYKSRIAEEEGGLMTRQTKDLETEPSMLEGIFGADVMRLVHSFTDYSKAAYQDLIEWLQNNMMSYEQMLDILSAMLQQMGWAVGEVQKLLSLMPPEIMMLIRHWIIEQSGAAPALLILMHALITICEIIQSGESGE